jgi:hypothetical protein
MKQRIMESVLFLIGLLVVASPADTLFHDDFQDAATSKPKWSFPDSVTSVYGSGAVTLHNKDTTYTWFVTKNLSPTPTFALSATITLTSLASNGVGIVCCKTDTSGIVLQLGTSQRVHVYQYHRSVRKDLLDVFNSFVSSTANVVTISKQGSTFNIFCNGNFLGAASVSDPLYTAGGDIAMIIPAKASAIFDNVVMTSQYDSGSTITCFSDDFLDANVNGWFTYTINGTIQPQAGKLLVSNTDTLYSGLLFVNGDFKRSSMKIITEFKQGKGVYGCLFVYTNPSDVGNTYNTYSFIVDSTQRYGVGVPDSAKIKMNTPKTFIHGATGDGKDTLEILRFNSSYKFKINGTVAEDALPLPARAPDGAGFYLGPKTSIYFDMFAVGGDSTGASCPVRVASWNPHQRFAPLFKSASNGLIAFDALGRINKRFTGSYLEALQKGASGVYFLRPANSSMAPGNTITIIK